MLILIDNYSDVHRYFAVVSADNTPALPTILTVTQRYLETSVASLYIN
ncbi:hypothetical protein MITS9509_01748 [Synechococcus sp. MIT S9509]|nr:hypothetical protein MITS9504_00351 [Synechococcus sp. MIT S9504]KZR92287.1 hypothetical protein MITS9509_01748 [Synechococcus sp. MIT S9509]